MEVTRPLPALAWLWLLAGVAASVAADEGERSRIAEAALAQVGVTTSYDPSYRRLDFPGGDVPIDTGVCADVVVRALRYIGIDLQRELYEDMRVHFAAYPALWGLRRPDRNIDHRRVPNLRRWFERHGWSLTPNRLPGEYLPGDLVSWRLPNGRPHIGVVSARRSADGARPLVVHNIAIGAQVEDVLLAWTIDGHFRQPETPAPR
ncbi:MAG: DUF1287 domain-containing protein [Xanthomonadales bacterium]|nr:DUF1287 domain-containing protein [Xanthomonadales bacterium]